MSLKFFNFHGHSGFSLYDGYGAIEDYIDFMLKNAGEDSGGFAITDHGHINSAGYFAAAQAKHKKKGTPLKLIWGCEAYYIPSIDEWGELKRTSDEQKELEKKEKKRQKKEDDDEGLVFENEKESKSKYFDPIIRRNHLVLTAYNSKGLVNLFRLVSRSHREGFYRKPRIDFRMLRDCNEGLIASTACLAGIPSWCSLQAPDVTAAHAMYDKELGPLMELFGHDRFFLELQFNKYPEQQLVNQHVVEYAKKTGHKLLATADSHFPKPEDWRARELYRMLGYQMKGEDIDKSILEKTVDQLECHLYLKNGDQLYQSYKDSEFGQTDTNDQLVKDAITRSFELAHDFCEHVYPDSSTKLPKPLKMIEGKTPFQTLSSLAFNGLKKKKLADKKEYFDRLVYELKIINKLNLSDYFLTKEDAIDTLRKHMLIGPGRGSGAGSLVNYVLNITAVDPIREGLLFERFLSSTKAEADIDTDVELRDQALDILKTRFGKDNVIAISNYNKLQLKSIVKDLSKLYGVPFQEVNKVTSVMEKEAKKKILDEINHDQKLYEFSYEKARKYSPTFAEFLKKYPNVAADVEYLYQEIKSIGKHAGGTIIVPDAESCIPVISIKDKKTKKSIDQSPICEGITAQHAKFFGLIKYDFLGLATLEIIDKCIQIILRQQGNQNPTITDVWEFYDKHLHPDVMDPKDIKVLKNVYWDGKWPSIFQFEEPNVQAFAKRVQPMSVDEISQITALWRPGALGAGADKKYLEANIEKQHPIMDEILFPTRNCLIYQEQFMFLAHKLAGFTLEEADVLRKILVKPAQELGEELKKQRSEYRERFIDGCEASGLTRERATLLWDDEIAHYISYGFNKSHSICYAYNSYACAWLFTYYPLAWLQASLETDPSKVKAINTIRGLGYDVLKVDINHSKIDEWNFVDNAWLPPLTSLKGLGEAGATELINRRPEGGFKNLNDFFYNEHGVWRWSKLNKKCIEVLIKMETFNSLNEIADNKTFVSYGHLYRTLFEIKCPEDEKKFDKIKKGKLKLEDEATMVNPDDFSSAEKIIFQKEIIGFYDKALIIGKYLEIFEKFDIESVDFDEEDGSKPKVWAVVENIEAKTTANNRSYYKITVSGNSSKEYSFKAWIKPAEAELWAIGNVMVFGLDYSEDWGYSLSKKSKIIKVTK
jgi:DNA polymerase-3 subunit alpha